MAGLTIRAIAVPSAVVLSRAERSRAEQVGDGEDVGDGSDERDEQQPEDHPSSFVRLFVDRRLSCQGGCQDRHLTCNPGAPLQPLQDDNPASERSPLPPRAALRCPSSVLATPSTSPPTCRSSPVARRRCSGSSTPRSRGTPPRWSSLTSDARRTPRGPGPGRSVTASASRTR